VNDKDVTACWPLKWRTSFEYENSLLADEGEELLTPEEFLQCRYEDWLEATDALSIQRSQRHHEVLLKVLEVQAAQECQAESMNENAEVSIRTARHWADLAYPEVSK